MDFCCIASGRSGRTRQRYGRCSWGKSGPKPVSDTVSKGWWAKTLGERGVRVFIFPFFPARSLSHSGLTRVVFIILGASNGKCKVSIVDQGYSGSRTAHWKRHLWRMGQKASSARRGSDNVTSLYQSSYDTCTVHQHTSDSQGWPGDARSRPER